MKWGCISFMLIAGLFSLLILITCYCNANSNLSNLKHYKLNFMNWFLGKVESHVKANEQASEDKAEYERIVVKIISKTHRLRREANIESVVVFELFRPEINEKLTVKVTRNNFLSSDFVLRVDDHDMISDLKPRSKRKVRSLRRDLSDRFYTGTVFSSQSNDSVGRVALTSFGSHDADEFMGLMSINGAQYIIEPSLPSTNLDYEEDALKTHFLIETSSLSSNRQCYTREHPQRVPLTIQAFPGAASTSPREVDARVQKSQPVSGTWVKENSRVLELAVFSDAAFFQRMKKKFPKNTVPNTLNYILASVNNMVLLYQDSSIGLDNKLEIRLNHVSILTKNPQKLNVAKGRELNYLSSFCKFAASKNKDNIEWDHAMMLTGMDLRDGNSKGVIGVAWTGAVCDNPYSCSLVEAYNFLGTYTMTHELGHSLGMNHDGEENNKLCDKSKYIMAAVEGSGQILWSLCSQQNLRDFLKGRSSVKGASNPTCLKKTFKKKKNEKKPIQYRKQRLPGEIYSAPQQCALSFGAKFSKPVSTTGSKGMCYALKCTDGKKAFTTQPALEGTTCGKQMWCQRGSCVTKPK